MDGVVTGCRFDKLPFDFAQGLSLSNGKALSPPKGKARVTFMETTPGTLRILSLPRARANFAAMSLAEVKRVVEKMSKADRRELAAHLHMVSKMNDPKWLAQMDREIDEVKAGGGVTEKQLRAMMTPGKKAGR